MENIWKTESTVQMERVGSYPQDIVAYSHLPAKGVLVALANLELRGGAQVLPRPWQ